MVEKLIIATANYSASQGLAHRANRGNASVLRRGGFGSQRRAGLGRSNSLITAFDDIFDNNIFRLRFRDCVSGLAHACLV